MTSASAAADNDSYLQLNMNSCNGRWRDGVNRPPVACKLCNIQQFDSFTLLSVEANQWR